MILSRSSKNDFPRPKYTSAAVTLTAVVGLGMDWLEFSANYRVFISEANPELNAFDTFLTWRGDRLSANWHNCAGSLQLQWWLQAVSAKPSSEDSASLSCSRRQPYVHTGTRGTLL